MIDLINEITKNPVVSSVETVLVAGRVKHYKINVKIEDTGLYKDIERLWSFGTVKIARDTLTAEYLVMPEEIIKFHYNLKRITSKISEKNSKSLDIHPKTVYN